VLTEDEIARRFRQSPLGGVETLRNPFATNTISVPAGTTLAIPDKTVRILEANLLEGDSPIFSSGSWVLTLDSIATFDVSASPNTIVPIHAKVALGTGGARQEFTVDARNTSFQLPASNITVDIGFDRTLPAITDAVTNAWIFPSSVRVFASLQRGVSNGQATRTIWLPTSTSAAVAVEGAIPNFARCFRAWAAVRGVANPFFTSGDVQMRKEPGSASLSNIMIDYFGPNLVNPVGVPVPTQAQYWQFNSGATSSNIQALEFDITL